jgi:NNP family nitrate/nitrite transporter-like MFS transporter
MFGLLNVVFRPLGGVVADIIYKYTGSVWAKKMWIVFCGITMGCFELAIGLINSHHEATMFGLVAGLAIFMDASNGANFAVVPHVHPFANGILSGIIGASGNLGGIIFAIVFRYNGKNYGKVIWIIGKQSLGVELPRRVLLWD